MGIEKAALALKFAMIDEPFSPRIVGELNGQHVKIVKVQGAFDWHHHANTGNVVSDRTVRTPAWI